MDRPSGVHIAVALIPVTLATVPFAVALPAVYLAVTRGMRPQLPLVGATGGVVLASAVIASLTADAPVHAWFAVARIVTLAAILVVAARLVHRSDLAALTAGSLLALLTVAAIATWQVMINGEVRATGTMAHPNTLGAVVVLVGLAASGWIAAMPRSAQTVIPLSQRREVWWATTVVAVTLAIVCSGSRGAVLAGVVGASTLVIVWPRSTHRRASRASTVVRLAIVAALAVVGIFGTQSLLPERRVELESVTDPIGRDAAWGYAFELIIARPLLGYGFEPWEDLLRRVEPSARWSRIVHVHNGYLDVALGGGVLLLIAMLTWVGSTMRRLLRAVRRGEPLHAVGVGTLAAFLTLNVTETYVLVDHLVLLTALPILLAQVRPRTGALDVRDDRAADAAAAVE